jgi:hypothetical protein
MKEKGRTRKEKEKFRSKEVKGKPNMEETVAGDFQHLFFHQMNPTVPLIILSKIFSNSVSNSPGYSTQSLTNSCVI